MKKTYTPILPQLFNTLYIALLILLEFFWINENS